jgi:hypothetical protein
MNKSSILLGSNLILLCASAPAQAQYPVVDQAAAKLVAKYQTSTCAQLARERANPPTGAKEAMAQRAGAMLQQNAGIRAAFVAQVAGPIVDKMIVCGFVP